MDLCQFLSLTVLLFANIYICIVSFGKKKVHWELRLCIASVGECVNVALDT